MSRQTRESLIAFGFLAPWLVGLVALTLGPVLASLGLSLTRYNLLSPPQWIGLDNYASLLADDRYLHSIRVTLTYTVAEVPLKLAVALLLAIVLDNGIRGLSIYRAAYYVPSLLGGSVAVSIAWRQMFGVRGLADGWLATVGWPNAPAFISDPRFSLYTLVLLGLWQFGSPMVIFLAGLRQIPRDLYEAARVDGAHTWVQFWHITVPLLTPLILFNLVLQMIAAFQAFTPAFVVSGGSGGPVDSLLLYTLYLYQQAFQFLHVGYGAAMAWVLLVTLGVLTGGVFFSSRYWVYYGDR